MAPIPSVEPDPPKKSRCPSRLLFVGTAIAGILLALTLLAGCRPASGMGRVSIRMAVDIRNPHNLTALEITVDNVGVQRADQSIDEGWITWQPARKHIDLASLKTDRAIAVGASAIPAGRYDRSRIIIEAGQAYGVGGSRIPLTLTVEPIALPFVLRHQKEIEITIELIALAQSDGGYELFTKSARISNQ